jgi:hypothetical protein
MPNGLLNFFADPVERANIRQGFMDAVNRGAVGAALGAPVDMVNSLLNLGKAGYGYVGNKTGLLSADQMPELIDNPVGGSEYIGNQMQRLGVVSPNRNFLAEGLAGFLPMSPSTSAKAVAAIGAGGLLGMPGVDAAATVWHGSPHKFDKFDSSKIGTGEGAQAYGHGLYLAESPEVAGSYQKALAHKGNSAIVQNGRNSYSVVSPDGFKIADGVLLGDAHKAKAEFDAGQTGSLYKVDLPDNAIARMLDSDKPLNEQAPEVLDAMRKVAGAGQWMNLFGTRQFIEPPPSWMTGGAAYARVSRLLGRGDAAASDALRQADIPGIRYLDEGSRGAGQGSSNYVVFPGNEGLLSILERNGQPLK